MTYKDELRRHSFIDVKRIDVTTVTRSHKRKESVKFESVYFENVYRWVRIYNR